MYEVLDRQENISSYLYVQLEHTSYVYLSIIDREQLLIAATTATHEA